MANLPRSDTYIEKDSSINEEIERLRLSTMGSLITRKDVIVVASVSCIYGLGNPEDYKDMMFGIKLLGICFWREAPGAAVGPDRRAGKRGLIPASNAVDGKLFVRAKATMP